MRSPNQESQQAYRSQGDPGSACWIDNVSQSRRGEGHAAIRTALEAKRDFEPYRLVNEDLRRLGIFKIFLEPKNEGVQMGVGCSFWYAVSNGERGGEPELFA